LGASKISGQTNVIMKDTTVVAILGTDAPLEWSPNDHSLFPISFQKLIYQFVLCLKRMQKTINIKIPRFVLYEIIKVIYY
jgi:hypothetical protein